MRKSILADMLALLVILTCSGCASSAVAYGYTAVSTGSLVSTGKSIPEQVLSTLTNSDCRTLDWLVKDRDYVCEQHDIGETYNRNGL